MDKNDAQWILKIDTSIFDKGRDEEHIVNWLMELNLRWSWAQYEQVAFWFANLKQSTIITRSRRTYEILIYALDELGVEYKIF